MTAPRCHELPNAVRRATTPSDMRPWPARRVSAFSFGCALALLGAGALAQADGATRELAREEPLRLRWTSSEPDCSGDLVAARALQLAGQHLGSRPVEAHAELGRDGDVWTLKLETRSANQTGERLLRGETCKEIQDAVALLLAMVLEAEAEAATTTPPEPPVDPAPAPAPPNEPTSWVSPVPDPNPEIGRLEAPPLPSSPPSNGAEAGPGWLLRLHGGATLGLQPDTALGFGGAAGIRFGAWDVAFTGSFWPSTTAPIPASPGGYVEIERLSGGIRGCVSVWTAGALSLAPCVLPELTLFRFESFGILTRREDSSRLLVSGTAALELRYRLFGQFISAVLSPGLTWEKRQPFEVELYCEPPCEPMGSIEVYETWGVGPRIEIGVDARF